MTQDEVIESLMKVGWRWEDLGDGLSVLTNAPEGQAFCRYCERWRPEDEIDQMRSICRMCAHKRNCVYKAEPRARTRQRAGKSASVYRREKAVVREIVNGLTRRGWKPVKNHGSTRSRRGRPDIEVNISFDEWPFAVPFAIEAKRRKGKTKAQQRYRLTKLREQKAVALVARGWTDVEARIEEVHQEILDFLAACH